MMITNASIASVGKMVGRVVTVGPNPMMMTSTLRTSLNGTTTQKTSPKMSNPNYIAGRSFEYEVMKQWQAKGYATLRASGSRGFFDVIAFHPDHKPEMIQCKVVAAAGRMNHLMKEFTAATIHSRYYNQTLAIRIKGSKEVLFTHI